MKDAISSHVYKSFQLGHLKPYQIPLRRPFIMLFAFISNFISIYKHKWFKLAWWSTDKHYHIVKPYKEEIPSSYSYQWCIQIILWIEKKPAQWEISNSTLIPYIEHLHFYDTVPLHLYYCRETHPPIYHAHRRLHRSHCSFSRAIHRLLWGLFKYSWYTVVELKKCCDQQWLSGKVIKSDAASQRP